MNKNWIKGNKRIYAIIIVFIILVSSIAGISHFGNYVTNGVRGFIYGEGQWTKAQKQAVIALLNLIISEDKSYYYEFENALLVNKGDRIARETLLSDDPDPDLARRGFLQGKNPPQDVDQMIWVFQNFKNMKLIRRAIDIWTLADERIEELRSFADEIFLHIENDDLTDEDILAYTQWLIELDDELTLMETEFSLAMSDAARQAGSIVFWSTILVSFVLTLIVAFLSVSFMRSLKKSNESIKASEKKFRHVLNNSRDIIYQLNLKTDSYDFVSSSVKDVLGFNAGEVMERGPKFIFDCIHPEDQKWIREELERLEKPDLENIVLKDTEYRVKKADGTYIWVNNKRASVRNENGEQVAIVGNVRDITDRIRQMTEISKSLEEKKILLAEIHHRVKNNLGIITSLIEIQKAEMNESESEELEELQGRIKSIALVHEKLYNNETLSEVNLSQYLRELTEIIAEGYQINQRKIDIRYNLQDLDVDITVAMPLGLICNELINNAFKHAFSHNGKDGCLKLILKKKGGAVELCVCDNAGRLPQNFKFEEQFSMGMTLINNLIAQLDGEISADIKEYEETLIRIQFNLEKYQESILEDS